MSSPAGWYSQPDGLEKYWDGQEWIAMRVPAVGVPTAEEPSKRKPTRPWLQKRFLLPTAALGIALASIVIVSSLAVGGAGSPMVAGAAPVAAAVPPPASVSVPEATPQETADLAATMTHAPVVTDGTKSTPASSSDSTLAEPVPAQGSVQPIAPPVEAPPTYQEPTIICPSQGLTIKPGPVSMTMLLGIESYNHVASGGTVTNRSTAMIDLWDLAPEMESLDSSGNVLARTWGTKFVYSAPAGQPKDVKFSLAPGASVPYVVDDDVAMPNFKEHVSWYTDTSSMLSDWNASQFQGTCSDPPIAVLP